MIDPRDVVGREVVPLAALGICEHCEELFSIEGLPGEAADVAWKCPYCGEELTGNSCGY